RGLRSRRDPLEHDAGRAVNRAEVVDGRRHSLGVTEEEIATAAKRRGEPGEDLVLGRAHEVQADVAAEDSVELSEIELTPDVVAEESHHLAQFGPHGEGLAFRLEVALEIERRHAGHRQWPVDGPAGRSERRPPDVHAEDLDLAMRIAAKVLAGG